MPLCPKRTRSRIERANFVGIIEHQQQNDRLVLNVRRVPQRLKFVDSGEATLAWSSSRRRPILDGLSLTIAARLIPNEPAPLNATPPHVDFFRKHSFDYWPEWLIRKAEVAGSPAGGRII